MPFPTISHVFVSRRDDEDMEAAAEKAAMERGKRLTKRGTVKDVLGSRGKLQWVNTIYMFHVFFMGFHGIWPL